METTHRKSDTPGSVRLLGEIAVVPVLVLLFFGGVMVMPPLWVTSTALV